MAQQDKYIISDRQKEKISRIKRSGKMQPKLQRISQ
jgi:hypothetical protein